MGRIPQEAWVMFAIGLSIGLIMVCGGLAEGLSHGFCK